MITSLAKEIAERFVSKLKFTAAMEEDANDLAGSCDIVLSKKDGWNYYIACIVDARYDERKIFGLDRKRVREILATRGRKYCSDVEEWIEPAVLYIVEVREDFKVETLARLRTYGNRLTDSDYVHAYLVDCTALRVKRATSWSPFHGQERFLRLQLREISRQRW